MSTSDQLMPSTLCPSSTWSEQHSALRSTSNTHRFLVAAPLQQRTINILKFDSQHSYSCSHREDKPFIQTARPLRTQFPVLHKFTAHLAKNQQLPITVSYHISRMAAFVAKITSITPRITRILGCNPGPMTLQGTNTYLIGTGKSRILLDAGEKGNADYISALLSVLKQQETTIDKIVITHWHHDHIGGLMDVLGCLGGCVKVYKFPRADAPDEPLHESVRLIKLKHNDEIKTEGATLKVLHTPGHTTDHVVLAVEEEGAVFSGDCILGEGTAVFEDLHTYMASLKETPEHLHRAAEFNVTHHLQKLFKDGLIRNQGNKWCHIDRKDQL
ncbi:endoribonuclease LACTB2-like isoform X3 [Procambarus clarkii]|uniref:endoribonuclease LACTB2-like isoform X3 n=1 Tax=Procambarus clarkii TaxID=6728 RepID=UPI001E6724A1|nr:endoribonuclease LACTB2-like isoform X1 [Procambarus clarkii]